MAVIIAGDLNKNDIIEMSGVMNVMEMELHNIKSIEGLIEKIEQQQRVISLLKGLSGAEEMKGMNDCIKIIKEYCGLEESNEQRSID